MPKNTFILVSFLAVFAAIVAAVNVNNYLNGNQDSEYLSSEEESVISPTPTIKLNNYRACGVSFSYPDTLTKLEVPDSGVMLVNAENPDMSLAIICQENIPTPEINPDLVKEYLIGTISANLYREPEGNEATSSDKLIFTHPKTGLDVMISGLGQSFESLLSSISLL